MEKTHAGFNEGSGEGAADGGGKISFKHDGVADSFNRHVGGGCDGFLDQGLLHADAHIAEHEFQQILGFERRSTAQQTFDKRGADGRDAGCGHRREGFGDFGEGQRRCLLFPVLQ